MSSAVGWDRWRRIGTLSGDFVDVIFVAGASGNLESRIPYYYTAIAEGDALIIVNRNGDLVDPSFDILPSGAGTLAAEPLTTLATLSGTPIQIDGDRQRAGILSAIHDRRLHGQRRLRESVRRILRRDR